MKLNPRDILFGDDEGKKPPVLLAVTPPRTGERTLLGVENLLQSIAVPEPFSLELAGDMDGVTLMARCLDDKVVRGQLSAHYPQARIQEVHPGEDPLWLRDGEQAWSITLRADAPEYVPLRTFRDDDLLDPGSDPLIALMGALSALYEGERVVARLMLRSLGPDWSQAHMDKAHKRPGMEPREPAYTFQTKPLQMDRVTMAVLGIGALAALKGYLWVQDGAIWKAAFLGIGTALGLAAGGWAWWRWKRARSRVEDPILIQEKVSRIAFDAELQIVAVLPDGRTVGVVRQGLTADRSGFAKRLWRLRDGPMPGTVLVLMADGVRLRHARRLLSTTDVPALFALEREALLAGAEDRIWSPLKVGAAVDLRYALDRAEPGGRLPAEAEPQRVTAPEDFPDRAAAVDMADHLLPLFLKPAEKRALDLVSDWPWIALGELAGLMGVSPQRASQLVNPLEGFGLATRLPEAGRRMVLTDRGLSLLARRDRTSVGVAKKRWSAATEDPGASFEWRNVAGRRGRQLLRNIEHTAAVHGFLAALTVQAPLLGWEIVQVDPPRRASRHFRHDGRMRAVNPDAFAVIRKDGADWAFFLEWERRAVRPSTMSDRLAPYLRYYSSHRPIDDHGTRPAVLVVFDDDIAQTHFLRVAREEMRAEGVAVPLWVSHKGAIDALGPLGRAWRSPGEWESPQAMPPQ